jgi:hypothetical protein
MRRICSLLKQAKEDDISGSELKVDAGLVLFLVSQASHVIMRQNIAVDAGWRR